MGPKQKAQERAAVAEAAREQKARDDIERAEAASWAVGAKDNKKERELAEKEEEKRRKAAEKAALEAEENAIAGSVKKVGKPLKKKDKDLELLNAALSSVPKTKAQKEAEAKKKADEERKKKEKEAKEAKDALKAKEAEEIKKAAARGIIMNHTDDLMVPINNRLEEDDFEDARGLDSALDLLSIGGSSRGFGGLKADSTNQKALFAAYTETMLPMLKQDLPGLKLSQYKERIFDMWQKAPENPRNQPKGDAGSGGAWSAEGDAGDSSVKEGGGAAPSNVFGI